MSALLGFFQPVLGAANDDFNLVGDPVRNKAIERERSWHSVNQGEHVSAEVLLQLRVLIKVIEHDPCDGILL